MSSGYRPGGCGQDRRHPHPRGSGRRPDADDLATDHQQSMVPVDPALWCSGLLMAHPQAYENDRDARRDELGVDGAVLPPHQ